MSNSENKKLHSKMYKNIFNLCMGIYQNCVLANLAHSSVITISISFGDSSNSSLPFLLIFLHISILFCLSFPFSNYCPWPWGYTDSEIEENCRQNLDCGNGNKNVGPLFLICGCQLGQNSLEIILLKNIYSLTYKTIK